MDQRLQEMLDHYQITRTLKEYCHACDRGDEEHMAGVYLADGWDEHGAISLPGTEFARVMSGMIRDTTDSLAHLLGQSLIEVRGDEAGAETYFIAVSHSTREDGQRMCNQLGGRFVDTLHREGDRWLIRHRKVVRDWSISLLVEADWTRESGLAEGARSGLDPSCVVLGNGDGD